jgi:hypothetical protein
VDWACLFDRQMQYRAVELNFPFMMIGYFQNDVGEPLIDKQLELCIRHYLSTVARPPLWAILFKPDDIHVGFFL